MCNVTGPDQAHRDEAGQRSCFEKTPAFRLNRLEHSKCSRPGDPSQQPGDGVPGRAMEMADMPHRDQRGQGITDDRQADDLEPSMRAGRQLEGELGDVAPGGFARAQATGQGT